MLHFEFGYIMLHGVLSRFPSRACVQRSFHPCCFNSKNFIFQPEDWSLPCEYQVPCYWRSVELRMDTESSKVLAFLSRGRSLTISLLTYHMLKLPLKCAPAGTVDAYFREYLNNL